MLANGQALDRVLDLNCLSGWVPCDPEAVCIEVVKPVAVVSFLFGTVFVDIFEIR